MSEEQLKAFIAKVQADTSLQEQLKAEGADPVAIAKAAGFSINTKDLAAHNLEEVSDEDLENVAGGMWADGSGPGAGAPRPIGQTAYITCNQKICTIA